MFLGAYWSQRQESREQAADRIARFLRAIAVHGDSLSTWFLKAWTQAAAYTPISCDPRAIAPRLEVNKRDVGGEVMPELGFHLGLWNGEDMPLGMSLSMTIGAYSTHVTNSVVLSLQPTNAAIDKATWRGLMTDAIEAFEPDYAVVTSSEHLRQAGATYPWEAGWLTYVRSHEIREHPWRSQG